MVVSKRWFEFSGERISTTPFLPQFNLLFTSIVLFLTSFLPLFNLNLTSASSRLSNHGLEITVYIPVIRKIRAPIKIKSALPPPPQKKGGILRTWFFLQKEGIFPGVHKIGAAISGPRIADTNFMDTKRIFLT